MRIAVYCSSQPGLGERLEAPARELGKWMGGHGHTLVYGGVNRGLMHTVAQACHDAGGTVVGVVPERFAAGTDPVVDRVIACSDLAERKDIMMRESDAFVVLPGGIGTLDEWISTLSQILVSQADSRPIVALNLDGMFTPTIEQLRLMAQSPMARNQRIDMTVEATSTARLIAELEKLEQK